VFVWTFRLVVGMVRLVAVVVVGGVGGDTCELVVVMAAVGTCRDCGVNDGFA
jgi:phage gp45-like